MVKRMIVNRRVHIFLTTILLVSIVVGGGAVLKGINKYFGIKELVLQKSVVLIDGESGDCIEISVEDCRDNCVDYDKDSKTILYINTENQVVERSVSDEKKIFEIEGINLTEKMSNIQYGPIDRSLCFINENEILQYSLDNKTFVNKTDGIKSDWRKTYVWTDSDNGYKLIDNGKYSELYSMDMENGSVQKVCEGWIQSIGQIQQGKVYALEVYSGAVNDSSTADLRNRVIEIDMCDGSVEVVQEFGSWMQGNNLFACDGEILFYTQIQGEKVNVYSINLNTGKKRKVYSTENKIIGLAVN